MNDAYAKWLDEHHQQVRSNLADDVTEGIEAIFQVAFAARERNCYYCMSFRREDETCLLQKARPPAFVLVHGCWQYQNIKDIPY